MRKLKVVLIVFVLLYLMSGLLLYLMQEKFIFLGETLPQDFTYRFDTPFQEHNIEAKDGGKINYLYFKTDSAKGLIIYFHGNAGNLHRWGEVMEYYVSMGYDAVIMDYRGYGKSTGPRSEAILMSDAQLVYDQLKGVVPEAKIILFGRSLGTGIAAHLASNNNPRMVILETPYYDMASLVQQRLPIFPTSLSLKYPLRTNEFLKNVKCPIHIFHGTEDLVVPFEEGLRLFDSLKSENAYFYKVESGGHNNLIEYADFRDNMERVLK